MTNKKIKEDLYDAGWLIMQMYKELQKWLKDKK